MRVKIKSSGFQKYAKTIKAFKLLIIGFSQSLWQLAIKNSYYFLQLILLIFIFNFYVFIFSRPTNNSILIKLQISFASPVWSLVAFYQISSILDKCITVNQKCISVITFYVISTYIHIIIYIYVVFIHVDVIYIIAIYIVAIYIFGIY